MAEMGKIVAAVVAVVVVAVAGGTVAATAQYVESEPGFAALQAGCVRMCNDGSLCSTGKKPCFSTCDKLCHGKAVGLAFAAKTWPYTSKKDQEALIAAIDKRATSPADTVRKLTATCVVNHIKFCGGDLACINTCSTGCEARSVYALATPAEQKAIKKDIPKIDLPAVKTHA